MKNAEAAISCQKGGVNSLRTGGWGGNFRTGKLPIFFFLGGGGGVILFSGGGSTPCYMPCVSFITVLYIHPKSIGTTLEIFPFPEAVQVFLYATPLPTVASTPIRTKTNHHWLYHLQVLHTQ